MIKQLKEKEIIIMLFVKNKTKAIQCLDGVLVPPASVEELKTLATKTELVKAYGKDILKALEPVQILRYQKE